MIINGSIVSQKSSSGGAGNNRIVVVRIQVVVGASNAVVAFAVLVAASDLTGLQIKPLFLKLFILVVSTVFSDRLWFSNFRRGVVCLEDFGRAAHVVAETNKTLPHLNQILTRLKSTWETSINSCS
jgi:hypothetical protein